MNKDKKKKEEQPVLLPTISSVNVTGSSSTSIVPNIMLSSSQFAPQTESPFLALTTQQRELQKLLMASIKRQVSNKSEDLDVREAFGLKKTEKKISSSQPMMIGNQIPYSKAAEEAIIASVLIKTEPHHVATESTKTYHIPTTINAIKEKVKVPKEKAKKVKDKESKAKEKEDREKEREEGMNNKGVKEHKQKDKEEIARNNKEKEEKNAFRLKQLNHELQTIRYQSFFLEESQPVSISRKKCHRDSLLEEIQWMAIDFRQERRWKLAVHSTLASSNRDNFIAKHVAKLQRSEDEIKPLKAICKRLSSTIEEYWLRFAAYGVDSSVPESSGLEDTSRSGDSSGKYLYEVVDEELPRLVDNLRNKRAMFEIDVPIQPRQVESFHRVAQINDLGYGAVLCGPPHGGRTAVTTRLIREWVKAATNPSQFCAVLSPWYAMSLWQYKLHGFGIKAEMWNRGVRPGTDCPVVLVCNKDIPAFTHHCKHLFTPNTLLGIVVDARENVVELTKSTSNGEILKGVKASEESYEWMSGFFANVDTKVTSRCVIVDDIESCGADNALLLAALIPFYFSYKRIVPPHRRCLEFMERLKVKIDADMHKPSEHNLISLNMSLVQRKKYINLVAKSEFDTFSDALCLLKRVCFHEMLVPDYILSLPENVNVNTGKSICPSFCAAYSNLTRYATLHISRRIDYFTLSGCCKLEYLIPKFKERDSKDPNNLNNKRVVIVVSTDMEAIIAHRCLQSHSIPHLFHKVAPNPVISHIHSQDTIAVFNEPSRNVGLIVVKDSVFSYPHISPINVDVMFILSCSWATCLNPKRCMRGQGVIHRLVAADTLEELMERKGGSFLHLQGYKIPDARPPPLVRTVSTFSFDQTKLLTSAPQLLEYVKELATPPPKFGLGKGKGCFLAGFQADTVPQEKEDSDSNSVLVQWISNLYYALETSEQNMNSRFDCAISFVPALAIRQCSVDRQLLMLNRYAALTSFRCSRAENAPYQGLPSTGSVVLRETSDLIAVSNRVVSIHEERMNSLLYTKASCTSTFDEDFIHNLHTFYREGATVDPVLYVSPLCASHQRVESMQPLRKRSHPADFEVQFMFQPSQAASKAPIRKSRGNTTGSSSNTGGATKRKSGANKEKPAKKAAVSASATIGAVSSSVSINEPSMNFDEFDMGFDNNLNLFDDEPLDLAGDMDLDF